MCLLMWNKTEKEIEMRNEFYVFSGAFQYSVDLDSEYVIPL